MHEADTRPTRLELWLSWVTRHPIGVLLCLLLLTLAALYLAATRLGVNSDPIEMLDEDLAFRQTFTRYQREFPQLNNTLLAVIEAPTPEQASMAAARVQDALIQRPDVAEDVFWPSGSDFFQRNGLLFLPLDQLTTLSERLVEFQPFLGQLAGETHAAKLLELLTELEGGAGPESLEFESAPLYQSMARELEAALEERPALLSWQHLLMPPGEDEKPIARESLLINPVLNHEQVLSGRDAMRALHDIRTRLGLDRGPVRMQVTGRVALRHEEMQSLIAGAGLAGTLALFAVSVILLIGFRSVRLSVIVLATLGLGLTLTAGFTALAVVNVNPISMAFVVLYIGLGANYAAHFLFRYREIAHSGGATPASIHSTGRFLLRPLLLSTFTTALGFFAFVPTGFSGVAQLGLIAGVAMLITLILSYSALPALLALLKPTRAGAGRQSSLWRPLQAWPLRHRRAVLIGGTVSTLVAALALPHWGFDPHPLNLRDQDSESVRTLRSLIASGEDGYRNAQVLVAPGSDAEPLRRELEALPSVERAQTLESLLPGHQSEKLDIIQELYWVLGPQIITSDWEPQTLKPERLENAVAGLLQALQENTEAESSAGRDALSSSLQGLLERLRKSSPTPVTARVNQALVGGLKASLGPLGQGLNASEPVTDQAVPDWFRSQWIGLNGSQLIQVYPSGDTEDFAQLQTFTRQVQSVAPHNATGGPVIQVAAGRAVTDAFRQALAWALGSILLVLLLALRSVMTTLKVLAPLLMGGILSGAVMVLLEVPLNFANVVALPLLLGVAVDNGIHLVLRHRAGGMPEGNVLRTATARAIVFGGLITLGGFGNLLFSPHAGTASLGLILMVGLGLMVAATLIFLPAALGRNPEADLA